ncbi:MAG: hypothetical protein AMJ46_02470 [Latescibacteria bacterium DG_63]|nr:MAG: hypothetical protein AMJ46_02470 [Latescibacteria bacterium DG_63]
MRTNVTKLVFLLVSVLVCGCGLFEPRVPDEPGTGGVRWIAPTEPESVFVNIKNSLEGKVIGNYAQCFLATPTDSFVFHPDPSDSLELFWLYSRDVFENWTLDVEKTVTQSILDEAASIQLTFALRDTTICTGAEECFFYYKYQLQVIYKVGGTKYYYGLADYHMRGEGGEWFVYMWIDKRDPDFQDFDSWGKLKGTKR